MFDPTAIAHRTALPAPPVGWYDYHYSVLMDGRLALVRTQTDVHPQWQAWWNAMQQAQLDMRRIPPEPDSWGDTLRISIFDGTVETDVTIVPARPHPLVELCADGRWLVVSDNGDTNGPNARFYTDGEETGSIWIGRSIRQLFCSPDGTIWVGYRDLGGLTHIDGDLVQLDTEGRLLWRLNDHLTPGTHCEECYAFSLNGTVAWTSYFSPFDIVRIENGVISAWPNSASGLGALAVSDGIALLAGGYSEHLTRVAIVELGDGSHERGGFSFPDIDRDGPGMVRGRDGILHVVNRGVWYRLVPAEVAKDASVSAALAEIREPTIGHPRNGIATPVWDW